MKFFNWTNIRLVLMISVVIFLFSFTSYRNGNRKITKTEVQFVGESTLFLKPEIVNKLLIEKNQDLKTLKKEDLDLNKLESTIQQYKMIQKTDVFVTVDGVLKAVVKQKTPLARVFDANGSFYIDNEGNNMPLSDNFTARVPLLSGEINVIKKERLAEIFQLIQKDDFLKKNIIGVNVLSDGSLIMANRNFDYQIHFGKAQSINTKFNNYKAFFQKAVSDSILKKYRIINLNFTNQVVCIK